MSLGPFLLGATVALMMTSMCSAGVCNGGPPGAFCLKTLVGYHNCVFNKKTGHIEDNLVMCPTGTRCVCMGIPCRTTTPCRKFELPPVMPDSYHTAYNEKRITCSPTGCRTTYSRYAFWRDATNRKYRTERTIGPAYDPPFEYYIYLPIYGHLTIKVHIVPSKRSCTKSRVYSIPPKLQVPAKARFFGRRYVYGDYCKRWMWAEGGRNSGQSVNVETWDTGHTANWDNKIVHYSAYFPGSQMSKTSTKIDRYYYLFTAGIPADDVFGLPTYCH